MVVWQYVKLVAPEENKHSLFADHVTQVCEAHDRVTLSRAFLQQVKGLAHPKAEGSRENIEHNVHM